MKKIVDWQQQYTQQRREELQKSGALNRLGQGNHGGVQRSPVRHEAPKKTK